MSDSAFESTPRKVDGQNRVAMPPEVLEALEVQSGDFVMFRVKDGEVQLTKVRWEVDD